jgi:hypothetical protein
VVLNPDGTTGPEGVRGRVLDLVAGLLDVGLGLLGLPPRFKLLVAGQLAGRLLDLADRFFGTVLDSIAHCHIGHPSCSPVVAGMPPPFAGADCAVPGRVEAQTWPGTGRRSVSAADLAGTG